MRKAVSLMLACVLLMSCFSCALTANAVEKETKVFYSQQAISSYIDSQTVNQGVKVDLSSATIDGTAVSADKITLETNSTLAALLSISEAGDWLVYLKYSALKDASSVDTLFSVSIENERRVAYLPILWSDAERGITDRSGNDVTPEQINLTEPIWAPLYSYTDIEKNPEIWHFEENGTYNMQISADVQPIEIYEIRLCKADKLPSYSDAVSSNAKPIKAEPIVIEAEEYALKSDSYIRGSAVRSAALYPYDSIKKRINILDGSTWNSAGQKVLWEFEAPKSGYYRIAMRGRQSQSTNKSVYRSVEIDGRVPYNEWNSVLIPYTGSTGYKNIEIKSGESAEFIYLEKGKHTIALTAVMGEYARVYDNVNQLMQSIDELGINLIKMTAGSTDANRTWDMDVYMPEAVDKIAEFADKIDGIYEDLRKIEGRDPTYAGDLAFLSEKLRDMLEEPEKIPNKTEEICTGDNSVSKYLGDLLSTISAQPLSIDRIYVYGNSELPSAKAGFFRSVIDGIKRFLWSFLPEAAEQDYNVSGNSKKQLQVWVGQSALVTGIMQQLVDEQYNTQNGTDIKLSIMPSEQKLVLANAAGTNPDVVLCSGAGTPYTFAIRGALKNLFDYEDFMSYYSKEYQLESLLSTAYDDGVYGVVDSRNFQLLFYRKDILESLELEVPKTWDDVEYMMPTLLRNNMNFYISLSSSAALKGLGITGPFIYQNGGSIYSDNGIETSVNSENAISAMTQMVEFYNIYGMQTNVPSFYNSFRYGKIPVGIGDFNMYLQLKVAAPELAGRWGVALTPGVAQENGSILRCQPANTTASFIFKNTRMPEDSWKFLKWWLSSDIQLEYSQRRSINLGAEYQWNTANIKAFSELSMDSEVKELAFAQWEQQREILPHPAAYIVEREISGVWNAAVIDKKSMIEALDKAVISANREIKRKLGEFGYIDGNGDIIKGYNTKILEMLNNRLKEEQSNEK